MIECLIVVWGFINLVSFCCLFESSFEFGDKDNFKIKDKTLLELFGQYIVLMPVMLICLFVMMLKWKPFKEK